MRGHPLPHSDLVAERDHPAHHIKALAYACVAICILISAVIVTVAFGTPAPSRCNTAATSFAFGGLLSEGAQ